MITVTSACTHGVLCPFCLTDCEAVNTWDQTVNDVRQTMALYECDNCGHREVHPALDT